MHSFISFMIGFGTGLFVAVGGAFVLKRTLILMDSPEINDGKDTKVEWSMGQAIGLASLWTSKLIGAGILLYLCQKWGYSTLLMGCGIPVGIILGVLIYRK